jgi:hypothetical protein
MSDKICVNCKFFDNGWCDNLDCAAIVYMNCHRFEPKPPPTVFNRITASPEVLAAKLVYCNVTVREQPGRVELTKGWYSTIIRNKVWSNEEEAIAATVEKLKEQSK